eukprot:gene22218-29282_t
MVRPMAVSTAHTAGFGSVIPRIRAPRVAIFVEPSPFSHVSGMKNRFESLIKGLTDEGDEVVVFTPDKNPPKDFCGAKLRPDVIHVSTPGIMFLSAFLYAKMLGIPLVLSYHTHITEYIPRYTWAGLVKPAWHILRWGVRHADLTLVTSKAMKDELSTNNCRGKSIEVWLRGVDTDVFNPKFRCSEMRNEMSDGNPEAPLLIYVGRLGKEKNISALKTIIEQLPGCRLALVGDGPSKAELEVELAGYPVKFMGMIRGERLSQAYASADIFIMPSETETLGFVVLEAMASGLAVVAVAAGGLTDILNKEGETGFLYPQGDYVKATQLARTLVEDIELRKKVQAAARAEVELFGWSKATKELREKQYKVAVRRKSGKERFWFMALRISVARFFLRLWLAITSIFRPQTVTATPNPSAA